MSLIYGINPVTEAIVSGKTINKIYVQKGNKEAYNIAKKARENRIVVVEFRRIQQDENKKCRKCPNDNNRWNRSRL